jgi:hypothetical protein
MELVGACGTAPADAGTSMDSGAASTSQSCEGGRSSCPTTAN